MKSAYRPGNSGGGGLYWGRMRILVVDDDPTVREMLKIYLTAKGYGVALAADGTEGFTKATQMRPHVVIMDIMMPSTYGSSVIKRMRELPELKNTPVIVHSGADESAVKKLVGSDDENVHIIPKPANLEELGKLIAELAKVSGIV